MKEALLYEKIGGNRVHCFLCSHHCRIAEGEFGFCGVRQNVGGTLYTQVYAKPIAMHVDPIEKKPLYHFLPGSRSFSLATIGCNFHCGFCQNWQISQASVKDGFDAPQDEVFPEEIVRRALENECASISYTYTEPTIFFEYAFEIAQLAKTKGLRNNFVTNGYMTRQAIELIKPYLDAANVDLKFFSEDAYKRNCHGTLEPVLDSIRLMRAHNIWVEVTTLIVPGENDSPEQLKGIAGFIAGVDPRMPWHISRFHPDYRLTGLPATPVEALKQAEEIGRKAGLAYVYIGNVHGWGNDTYCPACKKLLVMREGFGVREQHIKKGKCAYCNEPIAGVFA